MPTYMYIPTYLSLNPPTLVLPIYLPVYLLTYMYTHLILPQPSYLRTPYLYLPIYTYLLICTYPPTYPSTLLPSYSLPTYLFIRKCLPVSFQYTSRTHGGVSYFSGKTNAISSVKNVVQRQRSAVRQTLP